jgi:hypothetical protein
VGWIQVASFRENCNGPSGSIKRKHFLDRVSISFLRIPRTMQLITVEVAPVSSTTMLRYVVGTEVRHTDEWLFLRSDCFNRWGSIRTRRLVGPQFRSTSDDENKNLCPARKQTPVIQAVGSNYIILAHALNLYRSKTRNKISKE